MKTLHESILDADDIIKGNDLTLARLEKMPDELLNVIVHPDSRDKLEIEVGDHDDIDIHQKVLNGPIIINFDDEAFDILKKYKIKHVRWRKRLFVRIDKPIKVDNITFDVWGPTNMYLHQSTQFDRCTFTGGSVEITMNAPCKFNNCILDFKVLFVTNYTKNVPVFNGCKNKVFRFSHIIPQENKHLLQQAYDAIQPSVTYMISLPSKGDKPLPDPMNVFGFKHNQWPELKYFYLECRAAGSWLRGGKPRPAPPKNRPRTIDELTATDNISFILSQHYSYDMDNHTTRNLYDGWESAGYSSRRIQA